ncbi:hypothetical protein B1A99_14370 [Cohnella sp. CIP 111063]|uniref:helix-turn-helix transcriptional regulator n=1 Tax=unclassified Cohnella TaxID=2636738 RepID=UPI000B8C58B2|nr:MULTISPECIES: AraC family transcriptional regulator [unclassified Cohnella]OXS58390.1 hypothetical protein B1A99_14370 [Cohnella sp. CIP 111063]PRX71677.1 AraC-like DNA-binding protein [Cohnella sp. SGD-V74]
MALHNESAILASAPDIGRLSVLQDGELGLDRAERHAGANEPWSYRSPRLSSRLLLVAARGQVEIRSRENVELLTEGAAAFVEQGRSVDISLRSGGAYEIYLFHMTADSERKAQAGAGQGSEGFGCLSWPSLEHDAIAALCEKICARSRGETALERLGCRAALQELIYTMLRSEGSPETDTTVVAVERTKRYIDEHYAQRLTIDRLCRMARLNPKYYMELFKKLYGISPIAYLNRRRMAAARVLLLIPGASVREVSRRVGFSDEYYFSRKFKQYAGMALRSSAAAGSCGSLPTTIPSRGN